MKNVKAQVVVLAAIFLCFVIGGCTAGAHGLEGEKGMTDSKVSQVLERHQNELMAIPGVVGIAEGRCDSVPCIKVFIARSTPEITGKIPHVLEGVPVSVEVTGEFKPLPQKDK